MTFQNCFLYKTKDFLEHIQQTHSDFPLHFVNLITKHHSIHNDFGNFSYLSLSETDQDYFNKIFYLIYEHAYPLIRINYINYTLLLYSLRILDIQRLYKILYLQQNQYKNIFPNLEKVISYQHTPSKFNMFNKETIRIEWFKIIEQHFHNQLNNETDVNLYYMVDFINILFENLIPYRNKKTTIQRKLTIKN